MSQAYELAGELFHAFRAESGILTASQIERSGIVERLGHMTNVPGIVGWFNLHDRPATQRLSLGKNGLYFFTTTFTEYGGEVVHCHISKHSENNHAELLASVFKVAFDTVVTKVDEVTPA